MRAASTAACSSSTAPRAAGRTPTMGLPSKNVTALAAGGGYLYIGTDNGLVRIAEGAAMKRDPSWRRVAVFAACAFGRYGRADSRRPAAARPRHLLAQRDDAGDPNR